MVVSECQGSFKIFNGSVVTSEADFQNAQIDFTIDAKSINTDNEQRDAHLKSADFLDTEKYPSCIFKSTGFKKVDGKNYQLNGNFTMHGVTKPVILNVKYNGTVNDPYGNSRAGFKVTGIINRKDFGVNFGAVLDSGGAIVGDEVSLTANIECVKAK